MRERERALPEAQGRAEIVVGERERAIADRGVEPARIALERAREQRLRLRVVRRVVRLAGALQVGDAEIALEAGVGRMQGQPALQLADLCGIAGQRRDRVERGADCARRDLRGGGSTTPQAGEQSACDDDRCEPEHEPGARGDRSAAGGHRVTCCPSWGC